MRTITILTTIFILIGCTKSQLIEKDFDPEQMTHIAELKQFEDVEEINNSVFYLKKGDPIPVKLTLESQWFTLKSSQLVLMALQKIYFRIQLPDKMSNERLKQLQQLDAAAMAQLSESEKRDLFSGLMLFASRNGRSWAPINQPSALKKAFGIAGGNLSFGAAFSAEDGLWAQLVLKVLQKKP